MKIKTLLRQLMKVRTLFKRYTCDCQTLVEVLTPQLDQAPNAKHRSEIQDGINHFATTIKQIAEVERTEIDGIEQVLELIHRHIGEILISNQHLTGPERRTLAKLQDRIFPMLSDRPPFDEVFRLTAYQVMLGMYDQPTAYLNELVSGARYLAAYHAIPFGTGEFHEEN